MALREIDQKDVDEFVYPQDVAVKDTDKVLRYGGLTKREYVVIRIAAALSEHSFKNNIAPTSVALNACMIGDAVLAVLAGERAMELRTVGGDDTEQN